jgi:cell division protease FtsH
MAEVVEPEEREETPALSKLKRSLRAYRLRRRRKRQSRRKGGSRRATIAILLLLGLLLGTFAWALKYLSPHTTGAPITLDQLTDLGKEHRIASATFLDEDNRLIGEYVAESQEPVEEPDKKDGDKGGKAKDAGRDDSGDAKGDDAKSSKDDSKNGDDKARKDESTKDEEAEPSNAPVGAGSYVLAYPASDAAFQDLLRTVTNGGAEVSINQQTEKQTVRLVATYLLPLLILASVFGLLFSTGRGGGGSLGEVVTFGQIGKKRQRKGMSAPTTFADVGGEQEAVQELKEVVDYLRDPERYQEIGAVPPKGVLLFGPPGCGKTLLAKAVAGEAGVPFFAVAGAEFVESLVGVGAARVRDLFQRVRAVAPAIVFIDELDAAGRRRGHGGEGGGSDEREQTLNQLLIEMDGFEISTGIVVIGATNRPDILDPALLRPGRFDRHVTVEAPDADGRLEILMLHARGKPVSPEVDFEYLARRTPGFSGADLANVLNEGALLSLRMKKNEIETPELEEAIQRVLHGPKRRGHVMSPSERDRAAVHESGHAVAAAAVGEIEDLHRVSILQRGRGLGSFSIQSDADSILFLRDELYARLVIAMGGIAAEEMIFGQPSTGAEEDLSRATEIARDIAGRYGMSPTLGRSRLLASDVDQYLGGDSGLAQLSETTRTQFDGEVRRLIDEAEVEARRLLKSNIDYVKALASRLQKDETVEGPALAGMLEGIPSDEARLAAPFSMNGHSKRAPRKTGTRGEAASGAEKIG